MTTHTLQTTMAALRWRATAFDAAAAAIWGTLVLLVLCVAAMWLDVLLELQAALRIAAPLLALAALILLLYRHTQTSRRKRQPAALARRLDDVGGARGQIVSGAQLDPASTDDPLRAGLAQLAIDRAGDLAAKVPLRTAAPASLLNLPAFLLAGLAVFVAAVAILAPDLAGTQWLRFTDPFGDHPPFARVHFAVTPGNAKVIYGSGLDIRVTVVGPPVDRLEVVLMAADSSPQEVLPMFAETGARWRATITNVTASRKYFVRAAGARSRQYDLGVITVPKIQAVRVLITPPAYTRDAPYEGPIPSAGIAGLPGTRVVVTATSNRPLSGGAIDLAPVGPSATGAVPLKLLLQPTAAHSAQVSGVFTIDRAAALTLRVADESGQLSTESVAASIVLLADERPFIRILEPPVNSFATAGASIPLVLAAEDDYGVSRIELFRSLNDSGARPLSIAVPTPAQRRVTTTTSLDLASLGLQPGDIIKLWARVEDNDPAGAKGSESSIATVQIISDEEFASMVATRAGLEALENKYDDAQRRLEAAREALAKALDDMRKGDPKAALSDDARHKLRDLAAELQKASDEVGKLADFKLPFDIDAKLSPELRELQNKLAATAGQLNGESEKAAENIGGAVARLEKVLKELADQNAQLDEKAMQPLEHLAKIFPLIADEQKFIAIARWQADLATRLSTFKDNDGQVDDPHAKARLRDLEGEQKKIHAELDGLIEDITVHAGTLPDDPRLKKLRDTAEAFVEKLHASDAEKLLRASEDALAQLDGGQAHRNAQDAADALDKLISKCHGMGDEAGSCLAFQPKLSAVLGNTISQLLGKGHGNGKSGTGGYSMQSDTLENIGAYGTIPLSMQAGGHGNTSHSRSARAQGPAGNNTGTDSKNHAPVVSGSATPAPVPVQYQKRVGQYFQRVAEELDPE